MKDLSNIFKNAVINLYKEAVYTVDYAIIEASKLADKNKINAKDYEELMIYLAEEQEKSMQEEIIEEIVEENPIEEEIEIIPEEIIEQPTEEVIEEPIEENPVEESIDEVVEEATESEEA